LNISSPTSWSWAAAENPKLSNRPISRPGWLKLATPLRAVSQL